ncbi:Uncharacterised protein [Chryseobacterium nakagawai]|uniref:Uncharacterized protein n=1 Tax=Chryseobacterium nakagawai TaxID=1241982 RepID=A0AAD0YP30_CHRNA|nr:hypothetical protein EG343_20040 [Chryseobacterium nakagawai]VEH19317.1 Uncharacterised protein [Chryseobacterium nakagawai]
MSKNKYILLSIVKTWLISTVISMILLIVFMTLTREHVREHPRNCDMSGLVYGITIFWILFMSIISFSSLLSLLQPFQSKVKSGLCWFFFPILSLGYYFFQIGEPKINGEMILLFLIMNLPWFTLWIFYYSKFRTLYFNQKSH